MLNTPIIFVSDNSKLTDLAESIIYKKPKFLPMDTEFERRNSYYPIISLLQLEFEGKAYVIDALNSDISILNDVFLCKNITKVFHSAYQDIEALFFKLRIKLYPVIDSQVALTIAGFGLSISYESALLKVMNVEIDKKYQTFMSWLKRPLPMGVIEYAGYDVVYLGELFIKALSIVESKGLTEWLVEIMDNAYHDYNFDDNNESAWQKFYGKILNSHNFGIKKCRVAYAISTWRENLSKKNNIARQHTLNDDVIIRIAGRFPVEKDLFMEIIKGAIDRKLKVSDEEILNLYNDLNENLPEIPDPKTIWRFSISLPLANEFTDYKIRVKELFKNEKIPIRWFCTEEELYEYFISRRKNLPHDWDKTWRGNFIKKIYA